MARIKQFEERLFAATEPLEHSYVASGVARLCGVDEAGRGPLAGPVVAAAVIYRDCPALWNAADSKSLSPAKREVLFEQITQNLEFAVGICDSDEIDRLNILQASLTAMRRAIDKLATHPDLILVDGPYGLGTECASRPIVRGDARVALIGAASIVAKVARDRMMCEFDLVYPGYGFARHFGYPTSEHRRRIRELGPCSIHRKTFHGIREYFPEIVPASRG